MNEREWRQPSGSVSQTAVKQLFQHITYDQSQLSSVSAVRNTTVNVSRRRRREIFCLNVQNNPVM